MKQPKRPTRMHKECIAAYHLNVKNWAVIEETEFYLKVINKQTGTRRILDKYRR